MNIAGFRHAMLDRELAIVRSHMKKAVACKSTVIQDCIDDLMAHPGKLLRPSMLILAARAIQLPREGTAYDLSPLLDEKIYRAAAAVEVLHMATLVHDDVIDDAEVRRRRPSVYATHGAKTAVLVGDLLFTGAFQLVSDLPDSRSVGVLSNAIRSITNSEVLQMVSIDPERPTIRQYLHQIIGKTAVLFALACRVGAEQAGGENAEVQALQRAGYNIGLGFQIVDDLLDFYEDDSKTGKTPGRDLATGLLTLPVLSALRNSLTQEGRQNPLVKSVSDAIKNPGTLTDKFDYVKELIGHYGGFREARHWAARYSRRAIKELKNLRDSEARDIFISMTGRLLLRSA